MGLQPFLPVSGPRPILRRDQRPDDLIGKPAGLARSYRYWRSSTAHRRGQPSHVRHRHRAESAPLEPIDPTEEKDPVISRGWVQGVALVMLFGFFVMGISRTAPTPPRCRYLTRW